MDNKKPERRLILPEKKKKFDLQVSTGPSEISIESVINDGLQTLSMEVASYRVKVAKGHQLELKEARIVQGYLKTLVELMREQREQDRADEFSQLSTEELALLAKKVLQNGPTVVEVEDEDEEND